MCTAERKLLTSCKSLDACIRNFDVFWFEIHLFRFEIVLQLRLSLRVLHARFAFAMGMRVVNLIMERRSEYVC